MNKPTHDLDLWTRLRAHTPARIGLARAGAAVSTRAHLAFQMAHAEAQDAVHEALDIPPILIALRERGFAAAHLRSVAPDRAAYLQRPDLGRKLDMGCRALLSPTPGTLAIVIADGLSALAAQRHALFLLDAALPALRHDGWTFATVAVCEQARVALGDEIGEALNADAVAVLIGERPGLSSPDSLGVYLTWAPRIGRTDAERNCISNIRPEGLTYAQAAAQLTFLLAEARRRQLTGVMLKDESGTLAPLALT